MELCSSALEWSGSERSGASGKLLKIDSIHVYVIIPYMIVTYGDGLPHQESGAKKQ